MRFDYRSRVAAALLTGVLYAACGGSDGGDADAGNGESGGEAAAEVAAIDPSTVGTISGTINFSGDAPAMEAIDMSAEPDCAAGFGDEGPMMQSVVVNGGGLANVFVYLSAGVMDAPAPYGAATLDQTNCRYAPHVMGVQAGQTIEITNSDNLLHNINATPTENRGFSISQPRAGITSRQSFAVAEVMVPLRCDVHGWMEAFVGVVDHPYFGVSGDGGMFTISNVPAGTYTMTAWHEQYGTMGMEVTVTAGETTMADFGHMGLQVAGHLVGEPLVIHHGSDEVVFNRAQQ